MRVAVFKNIALVEIVLNNRVSLVLVPKHIEVIVGRDVSRKAFKIIMRIIFWKAMQASLILNQLDSLNL